MSELLQLWGRLRLKLVVTARLSQPLQRVIRKATCRATTTEGNRTDVAEADYREADGPEDTRLILIRPRVKKKEDRVGGKLSFDFPGYVSQALANNLPLRMNPLAGWRE